MLKQTFGSIVILAVACLLFVAMPAVAFKRYPDVRFKDSFVRIELAGARMSPSMQTDNGTKFSDQRWIKFDAKAHYYLELADDGAGDTSSLSLILSPDHKSLVYGEEWDDKSVKKVTLPHLTNGAGINIGDSPRLVIHKLGAAPEENNYNRKTKIRTYIYRAPISVRIQLWDGKRIYFAWRPWEYSAQYEFHKEKLWSIAYYARQPYHGE